MENNVAIIMCTYNGEKYIKTQIDSILNQRGVKVDIYIFDDCSNDNTINIIESEYCKKSNVHLSINLRNKGYGKNFLDGISEMKNKKEYDFYATSDQDDVWQNNKLEEAVKKIRGKKYNNLLYFSNLNIVDKDLNFTGKKFYKKAFSDDEVIFYNPVYGCTCVFNKGFFDLLCMHERYPL